MENNKPTIEEAILEIQDFITDSLTEIRYLLDKANEDGWSYAFNFDNRDILNAFFVFVDIIGNQAIKRGEINEKNAIPIMRQFVKDTETAWKVNINELAEKEEQLKKLN
jgi:hypothetical protein